MSDPSTDSTVVTMFDPQGVARDIPFSQINAARAQGAIPAVRMQAPQGDIRLVPANRMVEAAQNGGKVLPAEDQQTNHPGFWSSLGGDLKAMIPNFSGPSGPLPNRYNATAVNQAQADAEDQARKDAGYPWPYRAIAPVAEGLGVNVPGMEKSAAEGDTAGVMGHAATVPTVMAATAGIAKAAPVVADVADATKATAGKVMETAKAAASGGSSVLDPDLVGILSPRAANVLRTANRIGRIWNAWKDLPQNLKYPGARFPAESVPEAEYVDTPAESAPSGPSRAEASVVTPKLLPESGSVPQSLPYRKVGGIEPEDVNLPNPTVLAGRKGVITTPLPSRGLSLAAAPSTAEAAAAESEAPQTVAPGAAQSLPRTLSGESALRQVLTGQDNANLMKIAKSRGINVAQEAQLKPGIADNRIINKIITDFSPDELDEIGAQYMENTRFRHQFGDIGPEAWKTMSLQTYFPDLKIADATMKRTQAAIRAADAPGPVPVTGKETDLTGVLKNSLEQARRKRLANQ